MKSRWRPEKRKSDYCFGFKPLIILEEMLRMDEGAYLLYADVATENYKPVLDITRVELLH